MIITSLIFLAEMGDKTQLGLFSLALKYNRRPVFLGALCAFALMTLLAVVFGVVLFKLIPQNIFNIVAALLFIALGLFFILGKNNEEEKQIKGTSPFLTSFLLVSSAELGDKTQLLVAGMAIKYSAPFLVFSAAFSGLALASIAGLALVPFVKNRLSWIEKGAGLVLVLIGVYQITQLRL